MRSRTLRLLGALALNLLFATPPARAQQPVIDLTAIARAETEIANQLTQTQRLEAQLSNQAQMLQKMPADTTGPVAQITRQASDILQEAQGIGYGAQSVAQRFAALFPSSLPGANLAATQAALASWRQTNALALQQALQVQSQIAQGHTTVAAQVATVVAASQGAPGQTAAIQATNQLLATVTGQLTQLQALLITQARAEQTLAAQVQASQAAGSADSQRFWAGAPPPGRVQNPGKI